MSKQIKAEKTGQQQKKTNRPQQGKYNRNTGKKTVRSGSQELNSQKQLPHGEQSARNQRIFSKGRSTSGAKSKATQKTININIDQGYEESTRNNRQYDRPGRRTILSGTERIERSNNINNQYNSAAALRFGPGSKPITKSYGRSVPQTFRKNIPMVMSEPVKKESDDHLEMIEQNLSKINLLTGRNPIREAIKTGRDLEKLMIAKGDLSGSAREIVSLAKKAGIMIQSVERSRLDQIAKNHQGMIAFASAYRYATVEDILETAKNRGEDPFIIVLDQISDPHNLGAVIRTAACAGAHGVIVPLHRAVGLTPAAVKASAGAVEHIKVARVTNLSQTIKSLQKQGIWFYAAKMDGEDYRTVLLSGSCALVIGSEGEGVSQLIAQNCDKVISIPMRGEINSLNASVAAGILMYAVYHQRHPL